MCSTLDDLEIQAQTNEKMPSSGKMEITADEMALDLDDEEKALFKKYQPIITLVVYKFSYIGGHKRAEDAWKYYLGLEGQGLELSDVYQIAKMILLKNIRKIKNKPIHNVGAYLFKGLYRQLKYRIDQQEEYTGFDFLYEKGKELQAEYTMDAEFDYQELKAIMHSMLENLDERRRYVIEWLYGFNGREIQSMAAIGRSLGVSYQRIQGLHTSIMKRIRKDKNLMEKLKPFLNKQ